MAVLDYQPPEKPLKHGSLTGKVIAAVCFGVPAGVVCFPCAWIAVYGFHELPISVLGGPVAALMVQAERRVWISESALPALIAVAGAIQYTGYGLLLQLRFRLKWLVVLLTLLLHLGCFLYAYGSMHASVIGY